MREQQIKRVVAIVTNIMSINPDMVEIDSDVIRIKTSVESVPKILISRISAPTRLKYTILIPSLGLVPDELYEKLETLRNKVLEERVEAQIWDLESVYIRGTN